MKAKIHAMCSGVYQFLSIVNLQTRCSHIIVSRYQHVFSKTAHETQFCGVEKWLNAIHKQFSYGNYHQPISFWRCHSLVPSTWLLPRISAVAHHPMLILTKCIFIFHLPSVLCAQKMNETKKKQPSTNKEETKSKTCSNQQPTSSINICYTQHARVKTTIAIWQRHTWKLPDARAQY